jgi:hypothetical protein
MSREENWEGWAYTWLFSLPAMLVLSAAFSTAYPRYVAARSSRSRVALYIALVVTTVIAAPILTRLVVEALSFGGLLGAA